MGSLDSLGAGAHTWYGLPASKVRSGDLHGITAQVETQFPERVMTFTRYAAQVGATAITFPPEPPPPTVTVFSVTPLVRLEARIQLGQQGSTLGEVVGFIALQPDQKRAMAAFQSKGWRPSTSPNLVFRTPDYRFLPGWDEATYGLQAGSAMVWGLEARSDSFGFVPAAGSILHRLRYMGDITP
jgi:hypothetical protein